MTDTLSVGNIFLHVTKACNLSCKYCYISAGEALEDELTLFDYARIIPELVALQPPKIVFTGGEPLLHPHILKLLRDFREADPEHHVLRCLNSNGHLVTPKLARELIGLADEVRVSVDAMSIRNDTIRGQGNFEAAVKALETYYSVGFEPKVLITVTSQSLPDLEELLCFLSQKNFNRINLNVFRTVGRGSDKHWVANPYKVKEAIERAWNRSFPNQPLEAPEKSERPTSCLNCGIGSAIDIMPNGDVFPCNVMTQPEFCLGNVKNKSLIEICQPNSFLEQLRMLDFQKMAQEDERLADLAKPCCLGDIYEDTKLIPIWGSVLARE